MSTIEPSEIWSNFCLSEIKKHNMMGSAVFRDTHVDSCYWSFAGLRLCNSFV